MPRKTSKDQPIKGRNKKFFKTHLEWVCWGLVYIGNIDQIRAAFKKKFDMEISESKIKQIQEDEENQAILEDIRTKHDRDLHNEYLASKRSRLKEFTYLYERAKDDEKWKDAASILKNVDELMSPKKTFGDVNLLQMEQNNHYVTMPLEELEKKKLELLDKYSHVKMKIEETSQPKKIKQEGT